MQHGAYDATCNMQREPWAYEHNRSIIEAWRAAVRRAAVRRACLDPDDVRFLHAGEAADLKARPTPKAWRTHCREQRCKGLRRRADGGKVQRPARDDAMQSTQRAALLRERMEGMAQASDSIRRITRADGV